MPYKFWIFSLLLHGILVGASTYPWSKTPMSSTEIPASVTLDLVGEVTTIPRPRPVKTPQKKPSMPKVFKQPAPTTVKRKVALSSSTIGQLIDRHGKAPAQTKSESKTASLSATPPPSTDSRSTHRHPGQHLEGNLSLSEKDWIRQRLRSCWTLPIGLSQTCHVDMRLNLDPQGRVLKVQILPSSTTKHPQFTLMKESALRAVYHPHCNPLPLPKHRYHAWKTFQYRFEAEEG